jgi:hypothetical protein
LENWFDELSTYTSDGVVKMIVGNKNDKHGREVSYQEGNSLAAKVYLLNETLLTFTMLCRWKPFLLKLPPKQQLVYKMHL